MQQNCEICGEHPGTIKCLGCPKNSIMCIDCFAFTHKSDSKKAHQSRSLTESDVSISCSYLCSFHKQELRYICKNCNVTVCADCIAVGKHKSHEVILFTEAGTYIKERYGPTIKEFEDIMKYVKSAKNDIRNKVEKVTASFSETKAEAEKKFTEIEVMMQQKKMDVMKYLDEEYRNLVALYKKSDNGLAESEVKAKAVLASLEEAMLKATIPDKYNELMGLQFPDIRDIKKAVTLTENQMVGVAQTVSKLVFEVVGIKKAVDSFISFNENIEKVDKPATEESNTKVKSDKFAFVKTKSPYLELSNGNNTVAITGPNDCNMTTYSYCLPSLSSKDCANYSFTIRVDETGACGARRFGLIENSPEVRSALESTVYFTSLNDKMIACGEQGIDFGYKIYFKRGDIYKLDVNFDTKKMKVTGKDCNTELTIKDTEYLLFCGACCSGEKFTLC